MDETPEMFDMIAYRIIIVKGTVIVHVKTIGREKS